MRLRNKKELIGMKEERVGDEIISTPMQVFTVGKLYNVSNCTVEYIDEDKCKRGIGKRIIDFATVVDDEGESHNLTKDVIKKYFQEV
jgi:hypothetical protein